MLAVPTTLTYLMPRVMVPVWTWVLVPVSELSPQLLLRNAPEPTAFSVMLSLCVQLLSVAQLLIPLYGTRSVIDGVSFASLPIPVVLVTPLLMAWGMLGRLNIPNWALEPLQV